MTICTPTFRIWGAISWAVGVKLSPPSDIRTMTRVPMASCMRSLQADRAACMLVFPPVPRVARTDGMKWASRAAVGRWIRVVVAENPMAEKIVEGTVMERERAMVVIKVFCLESCVEFTEPLRSNRKQTLSIGQIVPCCRATTGRERERVTGSKVRNRKSIERGDGRTDVEEKGGYMMVGEEAGGGGWGKSEKVVTMRKCGRDLGCMVFLFVWQMSGAEEAEAEM